MDPEDIPLRVAYGPDLDKVKAILLEVARAYPAVLSEPQSQALLLAFGDDAVKFSLRRTCYVTMYAAAGHGRPLLRRHAVNDVLHLAAG